MGRATRLRLCTLAWAYVRTQWCGCGLCGELSDKGIRGLLLAPIGIRLWVRKATGVQGHYTSLRCDPCPPRVLSCARRATWALYSVVGVGYDTIRNRLNISHRQNTSHRGSAPHPLRSAHRCPPSRRPHFTAFSLWKAARPRPFEATPFDGFSARSAQPGSRKVAKSAPTTAPAPHCPSPDSRAGLRSEALRAAAPGGCSPHRSGSATGSPCREQRARPCRPPARCTAAPAIRRRGRVTEATRRT